MSPESTETLPTAGGLSNMPSIPLLWRCRPRFGVGATADIDGKSGGPAWICSARLVPQVCGALWIFVIMVALVKHGGPAQLQTVGAALLPGSAEDVRQEAGAQDSRARPVVTLRCGTVEGRWENGLAAFRGIPYGAPPTAARRWKPSEPASCWQPGSLKAHSNGPACFQGGADAENSARESEDCLHVNVFVPAANVSDFSTSSLPVLFWIHGGMLMQGSVASYDPIENLARLGSHVLVAMNYRLNIFGFLALPELAAVDPRGTSGNLGIADQQLALHWVQQNIAAFGGDPGCVTIIGQSSGGSSVYAHLAAAGSHGLFHRAIALSGSPNVTMDQSAKEIQDRRLVLPNSPCADLEGPSLLDCLYSLPADRLYDSLPESYGIFDALYDYPTDRAGLGTRVSTLLHVDGVTVSMPILHALRSGLNDVPLLLQSMQAEMATYLKKELANLTSTGFADFLDKQFSPQYGKHMAHQVYELYSQIVDEHSAEYAVYAVDADTASGCALQELALSAAEGFESPVYWGTVTASPTRPVAGQKFAFHNWDVQAATRAWALYNASEEDIHFGDMVREQWTRLAVTGHLDASTWIPAQHWAKQHMLPVSSTIEKSAIRPVAGLKWDMCSFWKSVGIGQNWWWIN